MAKAKKDSGNLEVTGSVPMKDAAGRKYKVRQASDHDFTAEPHLEGKIVQTGSLEIEGQKRPFLVVDTGTVLSRIYESKALEDAFRLAEIGDTLSITYTGEKDLGGGRTFKRFSVAVWSE